MRIRPVGVFLLSAVVQISGCVVPPTVAVPVTLAPRFPEVARLHKVMVLEFKGTDGAPFANALAAAMREVEVGGVRQFRLFSPNAAATGARGIAGKPLRDLGPVLAAGSARGVDVVYFGTVDDASAGVYQQRWETRRQCQEWEGFMKCKRFRQRRVRCRDLAAMYAVRVQAVEVQTGTVVYARNLARSRRHSFCEDQGDKMMLPAELLSEVRDEVAREVRDDVAPRTATLELKFKADAPSLPAEARTEFRRGIEFARAGRLDRACAIWQGLVARPGRPSAALFYNLGVCAEAARDYSRAAELYARADSLLRSPDRQVKRGRDRVLRLMGRSPAP